MTYIFGFLVLFFLFFIACGVIVAAQSLKKLSDNFDLISSKVTTVPVNDIYRKSDYRTMDDQIH